MVEEEIVHNIFLTNPIDLLDFLGRFVKIVLKNGEVITGTVYTIDPVSQSLILVNKDVSEETSVKIILKHSVNTMEIETNNPFKQQVIITDDIFNSNHFSEINSKEDVINWLQKNMIPVTVNGDKLVVDSLEIFPPYGVNQCYSSNSIVLSRIQKLLKQMPCKSS